MESDIKQICDIVIPVWNHLEMTRECINSIKKHTNSPYRLIIIDNASNKQTAEYLRSLTRQDDLKAVILRNEENKGFIKAVNQGMRFSDAHYVCIMNNDTVVTNGWLRELIDILRKNSGIGIINPSSNTSGQFPGKLHIDTYAERLKGLKGEYQELYTCRAFAMVVKREVIDKIGYLDEIYGIGYFDDTDYCKRTQKAGYKTVRAKASYVYHKGSQSFSKLKEKKDLFRENENRFISKWGRRLRVGYVIPLIKRNKEAERISHNINAIVKKEHEVWIFTTYGAKRKYRVIDHDGIRFFYFPNILFSIVMVYKIWKRKKKKKMHLVLTNHSYIYKLMYFLKKIVDSEIFMDKDFLFIEKKLNQMSHMN